MPPTTRPACERLARQRLHAIINANGPALAAKTWYGMPAYAKDGDVVCFFQSAPIKSREIASATTALVPLWLLTVSAI
jgi:hypothetical protein